MRLHPWLCLLSSLFLSVVIARPLLESASHQLSARHGDEHEPATEVDHPHDSEISYFQYDYDPTIQLISTENGSRHGGLMVFHGLVMVVNYMLLLPTIIVLRSNRHRLSWIFTTAFWALNLLGWSTARAYRRRTPDLYPGSSHGKSGAVLLVLSCLVTAADSVPILLSVLRSIRLSILFEWDRRLRTLVTKKSPDAAPADEAYLLVGQSTDKDDACHSTSPLSDGRNDGTLDEIDMLNSNGTFYEEHNSKSTSWTPKNSKRHRHIVQHSLGSDHSTLHEELPTPSTPKPRVTIPQRILIVGRFFLMILERCLVPYAWGQSLSGFSVYFGLGHTYYINGVLAHFIKGSIFWWFGILTFARYLGAWSRWGWAWNIPPHNSRTLPWSASFVESLVIFLYGFSQQFMERFGTHPGDPYSAKDVEHISIAVMFWAGGLVGMAIETPTIRKWLQGETDTRYFHSRSRRKHSSSAIDMEVTDSLAASNPLPALVIGITGIAMSAHHQTYQFQVQIHALWGYLLLGFAICRCLTCFFEWVRPERRMPMLPSMPPTELLGSIFLGAGGIAFICSDEEITLWAMRTHRDDAMMFLNLSIAVTCVAYVWCTFVLTIGGKTRSTDRRL